MSEIRINRRLTFAMLTLTLMVILLSTTVNAVNTWTQRQITTHEIAELARSLDLPENNPIIIEAKRLWDEEYTTKTDATEQYYTKNDAEILAKIMYSESRGIASDTEKACLVWVVLNRVDAGYADTIAKVATAPAQFGYNSKLPVLDNFLNISLDVLNRWEKEKNGESDVGRVLPKDYFWYSGDGIHNYFRNSYQGGTRWDYSLVSPYSN